MEKSNEIIQRYSKGIAYEEDVYTLIYDYGVRNHDHLIGMLNNAIKDFLENADIQDSNEIRNRKEFEIFANVNGLTNQNCQTMFAKVLDLVLTNRIIKSEYSWEQEKPKNLIEE